MYILYTCPNDVKTSAHPVNIPHWANAEPTLAGLKFVGHKYTETCLRRCTKTYHIVPNKRSLRIDTHPGEFRGSRETLSRFFSQFCSFWHQFSPILNEILHQKVLGQVYLSRRVYSALYGVGGLRCGFDWQLKSELIGICTGSSGPLSYYCCS